MNTFRLEMVTPEETYPARAVEAVDVPAAYGRLTVLAGHEPFVCSLGPGELRIRPAPDAGGGETPTVDETWTVRRGTLVVERESVTLLVRGAERKAP